MVGAVSLTLDMLLLFVHDMEKEVAFWGETVGLPLTARHGDAFAEFDMGGGRRLGLHSGVASVASEKDPHPPQAGGYIPAFTCDDIESAAKRPEGWGVALISRQDQPYALILTYADPEGNLFELTKSKQP